MVKFLIYQTIFFGLTCAKLGASGSGSLVSNLRGTITDSETGYALPFATVGIAGTSIVNISLHQGMFQLEGELEKDL